MSVMNGYPPDDKREALALNKRQDGIFQWIVREGQVKLTELSKRFGVTEVTIRRDLEKLERKGVLHRTFGGAVLSQSRDVSMSKREHTMSDEKERIGKAAAALVRPGESIFLDSGTTTLQVARYLDPELPITVVTHAISIVTELQSRSKSMKVIVLGGMLWEGSSSLVGPSTEEALRKYAFDRAFISATGVTVEHGFSNSNIFELQIKRMAALQAKEANVVVDRSKFGVRSLASYASLDQVHRIITDDVADKEIEQFCRDHQVEIMKAK
ncbi:MAG: DeoR/GlpR transcriptional regulator [Paenibacillaceae bacterium]|nr:DeoR/GlpR transcriptional regulator [Paenibacillaceae bacterium]